MSFLRPELYSVDFQATLPRPDHRKALQNIEMTASHESKGTIGTLSALRITCAYCGGNMLGLLDQPQSRSYKLGEIFDRIWRLGKELNEGVLIYISHIDVKKDLRGQGIGAWMLGENLTPEEIGPNSFTLVNSTTGLEDEEMRKFALKLFHSLGFRRIGRTVLLALSLDASHRSKSLNIEKDTPLLEDPKLNREIRHAMVYPLRFHILNEKNVSIDA